MNIKLRDWFDPDENYPNNSELTLYYMGVGEFRVTFTSITYQAEAIGTPLELLDWLYYKSGLPTPFYWFLEEELKFMLWGTQSAAKPQVVT